MDITNCDVHFLYLVNLLTFLRTGPSCSDLMTSNFSFWTP